MRSCVCVFLFCLCCFPFTFACVFMLLRFPGFFFSFFSTLCLFIWQGNGGEMAGRESPLFFSSSYLCSWRRGSGSVVVFVWDSLRLFLSSSLPSYVVGSSSLCLSLRVASLVSFAHLLLSFAFFYFFSLFFSCFRFGCAFFHSLYTCLCVGVTLC